jgi:hypothetical protein
MRSTLDISSALFQLVNIPIVKNEISGKVHIGDAPNGSQLEEITIKVLNNPNTYLQNGFINLNIYTPQLKSGRANLERLQQLIGIIIPLIKDVSINSYHFQIDDDKGVFKDQDNDGMYFYNFKIEFQTI